MHAFCVDLTDVLGLGAPEHLRPLRTAGGPLAVPIDRAVDRPGLGRRRATPSRGAYRDYHHHTVHAPPAVGQRRLAPTTTSAALALGPRARRRLRGARAARGVADGGLCVCAIDTELLGHWWYEGVALARRRGRRGRPPGPRARRPRRRAGAPRAEPRRPAACPPPPGARRATSSTWDAPERRRAGVRRRAPPSCASWPPGEAREPRRGARAARAAVLATGRSWSPATSPSPTPRERAARHRAGPRRRARLSRLRARPGYATSRRTRPPLLSSRREHPHPDPLVGVPAAHRGRPRAPRAQALRAARRPGRRGPRAHARHGGVAGRGGDGRRARPPRARARAARATSASSSRGSST